MTASIHYTPVVNNLQLLKVFSLRFVNMNETIMSVYKNKHHPKLDQARLTRRLVYPVGGARKLSNCRGSSNDWLWIKPDRWG